MFASVGGASLADVMGSVPEGEKRMNNDKSKGKWHQLKGEIKRKLGGM
jgi:hypothetical protein